MVVALELFFIGLLILAVLAIAFVSVTVYCTDLGLYDKFNDVYRTYFHSHFPTRAFIGVNALVLGAHFEVAGIAVSPIGAKKL